jgi:hypothetical protein
MFQVTVLIPVRDNAGVPFLPEDFAAFEQLVLFLLGGFTLLPSTAAGLWAAEGVAYSDDLRIYLIAVASITHGDRIAHVVAFAKVRFRQEAIFVAYLGVSEVI